MIEPRREDDVTRLDELIGEYMTRMDRGEAIDREPFIAEHPEFAEELRAHFANEDSINAALGGPPVRVIRYFGDYRLLEEIGRGGMGVVYRARQVSLNRLVAVKLMSADRVSSPEAVRRFRQEAEAAANLQHDNIVAVHEVGEHEGRHYFSMDFVEGRSLAEVVRESPLSPRQAASYLLPVAEAIDYAHRQGTLHRDLKPSNILIGPTDKPVVTDFGLAKRVEHDSGLTQSGDVVGSPSYMPPEQAAGRSQELSPASDVYSLGATLYELVTGRPPFRAETPASTLLQVLNAEPVSPRLLNPALDRDLETICLKCLEKEPRRRYQTTGELAEELRRFLAGEPIRSRPISRMGKFWRWCCRNPMVAALTGTLAVLTIIVAVVAPMIALNQASLRRAAGRPAR